MAVSGREHGRSGAGARRSRAAVLLGETALATTPPVIEDAAPAAETIEAKPADADNPDPAEPGVADRIKKDLDDMATVSETMTDKVEGSVNEGADRARMMFGEASERAKTAFDKAGRMFDEMLDLAKGNVEAVVASGRVAAKGAEAMAHEASDYGRKSLEQAQGLAKSYAAVRSPADLMQLNSQLVRSHIDAAVGSASRMSESYVKLVSAIAEPISSRFSVAQDKLKGFTL